MTFASYPPWRVSALLNVSLAYFIISSLKDICIHLCAYAEILISFISATESILAPPNSIDRATQALRPVFLFAVLYVARGKSVATECGLSILNCPDFSRPPIHVMQTHTTMKRSRGPSDASQYHSRRISVDFRHTSHLTTALSPAEPFPLVYMQDAPETTPYPEHPIRFTQDNPHSLAPHSLSSTWHLDDTMGCEEPSAAWNSGGVVDFEMREPGYGFEQAHKAVRSHSLEWSAGESSHNSVWYVIMTVRLQLY